jgi:hypothetical protein
MTNHRVTRGRETQKFVADFLKENGYPFAEPVGAGRAGSDVTGTPGIDWEVFARRDGLNHLLAKMRQSNNRSDLDTTPVVVMRPDGWGEARVADYPCIVPLSLMVELLAAFKSRE